MNSRKGFRVKPLLRQSSGLYTDPGECHDNLYAVSQMPGCAFAYATAEFDEVISFWEIPWEDTVLLTQPTQQTVFIYNPRKPDVDVEEIEEFVQEQESDEMSILDDDEPVVTGSSDVDDDDGDEVEVRPDLGEEELDLEQLIEEERSLFVNELLRRRDEIIAEPINPNLPVIDVVTERVDLAFQAVLETLDGKGEHPACMVIPYESGANEVIMDLIMSHPMQADQDVRPTDIAGELAICFFEGINS